MSNVNSNGVQQAKQWYVMLHLEPEIIERYLQMENEQRQHKGLRLLEYFLPHRFLPKAEADKYAKDYEEQRQKAAETNDMRRMMHNFVFIKATHAEILQLVTSPWNREGRLSMHFYYSKSGTPITMPEKMMESFITLCVKNRQRFSFGPPVADIDRFDTVVIAQGAFKDTAASVLDIQHTVGGVSLTLGIPFFNGEKTLRLPGYTPADLHLPHAVETLLNSHFVDDVETEIAAILMRRVKGRQPVGQDSADAATLNHLFHYSYVRMHDTASNARFRALMLMCAALRADADSRRAMTREVETLLEGRAEAETEQQAYLMAALYVATANADYRTAAKHYQQQHADEAVSLNRIMSPVKRLNRRFFKSIQIRTP